MRSILLDPEERERYVAWHNFAYTAELKAMDYLKAKFPRIAIIQGYYAMHNLAKRYLGEVHNIKIGEEDAHSQTIKVLQEKINTPGISKEVIRLMKLAQKEFEIYKQPDSESLIKLIRVGRKERRNHQYYANSKPEDLKFDIERFEKHIVEPFVKIMVELDI